MIPLVTVITPTTHYRKDYNERIKAIFEAQDYPNKEMLMSYDELPIGSKRNHLCRQATGDIIVHMDSDDIYATDWISKSVAFLQKSGVKMVGLKDAYFYNPYERKAWFFSYKVKRKRQLSVMGATMCYWKSTWDTHKFPDQMIGEDTVWSEQVRDIASHEYINGFIATIHGYNTASHQQLKHMQRIGVEIPENILNSHYKVA